MKLSRLMMALALPVLWSCTTERVTSVTARASGMLLAESQDLPLVYAAENTGANFAPVVPSFDQSPSNLILPDPFRLFNGGVDVTFGGWERRRAEILASIEQYEIGPKPPASDVDIAATMHHGLPGFDTLIVVVTRKSNQQSLTLKSRVNLPVGSGPFPAIIGMNSASGSIPSDVFTSRNIARVTYRHNDVTTYYNKKPTDPYFRLYPEYGAAGVVGQYSAWAWGVSRLIDGLQIVAADGSLPIDMTHVGVTGCSYAGKMAMFAGALDERVALTIAQESGGGGIPAWRASWVLRDPRGDVERMGNTDGNWFITGMKRQFDGDAVFKLPHDHHELMALVAPRALLATNNLSYVWLSNPSAYIDSRATQETYRQMGIGDRFGFFIDGNHSHCQVPATQRPAIEAFVDKFLLGLSANTDVQTYTGSDFYTSPTDPEFDYQGWMPWSLRRDISQLVAGGTLTADQGAGLSDKLEAALSNIAAGKTKPALNQLDAFVHQVNAFVDNGKLTPEQGAALIAKVTSTQRRLGA